ncbi:MAG: ABC transporter permease [Bdellovibrionales bacterium]|nr:ABC transporter permease [Bdellovibrionales bacterium]
MLKYILNRISGGLITVFFLATVTFFAMHMVPGDPLMSQKAVREEVRQNLMEQYGLDKPLYEQYLIFLKKMVHGDFGISYTQQNRSVNDIIREHFPVSASLGILAILIATSGGILWGSLTALKKNQWSDRFIMFAVILCVSVPSFVIAAVIQFLISELNKSWQVEVLPVAGWGTFQHMILPALILGLGTMAFLTRLMRSSMLEVVHQDYIRTAKAKGLSSSRIFWKHQFRNAVLPVITYLGPSIAAITTGGFVAEVVFAVPGLGRYFIQAVQQLDYTVIMGLTVFYGAFLVFMVMVVDIAYGFIDPRIKIRRVA